MKNSILVSLALAFGLVSVGGSVLADDKKAFKFVPRIQLPQNLLHVIRPAPAHNIAALCKNCQDAEKHAHKDHAAFLAKHRQCHAKNYTEADQRAAGCKQTDTLAACHKKLLNWCEKPARDHYNRSYAAMKAACEKLINHVKQHIQNLHFHGTHH